MELSRERPLIFPEITLNVFSFFSWYSFPQLLNESSCMVSEFVGGLLLFNQSSILD